MSPLDARLVRAAFASDTLARTLAELAELADDDAAFDAQTEGLARLHRHLAEPGRADDAAPDVAMLSLPARWLAAPEGERRLTNYLHLAELL